MQNSLQIQECLKLAGHILFQIHGLFDQGVLSLARECAVEQKLDDQKLDQHQFASYEIDLVSAELLAAETALHHANVQTAKLDAQLALIFACDAISLMLSKLEGVFLDLGHDTKGIHAMLCSKDLMQLRKACTSSSALAAIGRAVYSALVEQLRTQDGMAASNQHQSQLEDTVSACKADALGLKIEDIILDAQSIPTRILDVLRETQSWLIQDCTDPSRLYEAYAAAENRRKGARARLAPTLSGKERRAEWDPDKHPTPERLHYRWKNVRRLLMDLQGDT